MNIHFAEGKSGSCGQYLQAVASVCWSHSSGLYTQALFPLRLLLFHSQLVSVECSKQLLAIVVNRGILEKIFNSDVLFSCSKEQAFYD